MSSLEVPPDVVDEILKNVNDDRITLLSSRSVCRSWARLRLNSLLSHITFRSWNDIRDFLAILSSPLRTFPDLIQSKRVTLNGLTAMDDEAISTLRDLMSKIAIKDSLAIQVTTIRITEVLAGVAQRWCNIHQLTLSGGTHPPAPFFQALSAFPRLESLSLREFRLQGLVDGDQGTSSAPRFMFPTIIKRLFLVSSASLWPFFRSHVIPSRGLDNVDELCIEERFCFAEEGVWEMMECFRDMDGPPTLRLRAIYEPSAVSDFRDISMC